MTEDEWLSSNNPVLMVRFVRSRTWRKRCLLICACWGSVRELLTSESSRSALAFLESVAEAERPHESFDSVAADIYQIGIDEIQGELKWDAPWTNQNATFLAVTVTTVATGDFEEGESEEEWIRLSDRASAAGDEAIDAWLRFSLGLCNIARCIFGNPFRSVSVNPSWRTATVSSLAQSIYDERAFDRLPILADALEEAGCTNAELLSHCRGPGPHVRGCWAVDLLLGKE